MEKLITLFTLELEVPYLISQILDFMMHRERKEQLLKYMGVDDHERHFYEDLIEERWELLKDVTSINYRQIIKIKLFSGSLLYNRIEVQCLQENIAEELDSNDFDMFENDWLRNIRYPIKNTNYVLFVNNNPYGFITDVLTYSSERERDKAYDDFKFVFRHNDENSSVNRGYMLRRENYDYVTIEESNYRRGQLANESFRVHHTPFKTKKVKSKSIKWKTDDSFGRLLGLGRLNVVYSYNPKKKKIIWIDILENREDRNAAIKSYSKRETKKGRILCTGYSYRMKERQDIFVMILNGENYYFDFY